MKSTFAPGITLIPYSLDRVEIRKGVWNSDSTIIEDDDATGTLWPAIELLRKGTDHSQVIAQVDGLTSDSLTDLVNYLGSIGVLLFDDPDSQASSAKRPVWILSDNTVLADTISGIISDNDIEVTILSEDSSPKASLFSSLHLDDLGDELKLERVSGELADVMTSCPDPVLVVALTQNNPALLRVLDQIARKAGLSWLHATVDGPALYVGPFVVPNRTVSYRTFEKRVAMNLREHASYLSWIRAYEEHTARSTSPLVDASTLHLLASLVANEVCKLATNGLATTRNKVLSIYLPTMEIAYNDILPMAVYDGDSQFSTASDLYYDIRTWLGGK